MNFSLHLGTSLIVPRVIRRVMPGKGARTGGVFGSKATYSWRSSHVETKDLSTGEVHEYDSGDEIPPSVRKRFEELRNAAREEMGKGLPNTTFTYKDEASGETRTYHSLDEMPPNVRRLFENML